MKRCFGNIRLNHAKPAFNMKASCCQIKAQRMRKEQHKDSKLKQQLVNIVLLMNKNKNKNCAFCCFSCACPRKYATLEL
jgi:hypothetical protein